MIIVELITVHVLTLRNNRVIRSNMPSNPITLIPYIDLAKAQLNCGKEKLAVETLKAVVKDLEDFIEACNHD